LKTVLHAANEDWQAWTLWYEDRVAGRVRSEAHELAYVHIDDGLWGQGPAAVNAEIKSRIEVAAPDRGLTHMVKAAAKRGQAYGADKQRKPAERKTRGVKCGIRNLARQRKT
jgi:hypothetical protein